MLRAIKYWVFLKMRVNLRGIILLKMKNLHEYDNMGAISVGTGGAMGAHELPVFLEKGPKFTSNFASSHGYQATCTS